MATALKGSIFLLDKKDCIGCGGGCLKGADLLQHRDNRSNEA